MALNQPTVTQEELKRRNREKLVPLGDGCIAAPKWVVGKNPYVPWSEIGHLVYFGSLSFYAQWAILEEEDKNSETFHYVTKKRETSTHFVRAHNEETHYFHEGSPSPENLLVGDGPNLFIFDLHFLGMPPRNNDIISTLMEEAREAIDFYWDNETADKNDLLY